MLKSPSETNPDSGIMISYDLPDTYISFKLSDMKTMLTQNYWSNLNIKGEDDVI